MSEMRHRRPQQMRTFWPCNGFLSPIVPGPNMPLPAPPPPVQYAMPIHPAYQPVVSLNPAASVDVSGYGQYRGSLRSVHTHSRVYEYQRVEEERINSTNGSLDYVTSNANVDPAQNLYGFESELEFKEATFSPRGSSTINSSDSSDQLNNMPLGFSAARLAGDGSSNDSSPAAACTAAATSKPNNNCFNCDGPIFNSDGTVTVSQSKYIELTRLALRGSEIAEKLAYTHRNRPCFKKIDSLCARMKQDLIRPDGVLPNINSQGIAWAIKDMIFVFTRIISAWIIIKGYVFNTPDGLNKVKSALCKDFVTRFLIWQDATFDFTESLVRSFISLDNLVQSQKTAHQKSPDITEMNINSPQKHNNMQYSNHHNINNNNGNGNGNGNGHNNNTLFSDKFDFFENRSDNCNYQPVQVGTDLNKNYLYTMVKDSENSQREATVNGTYFKTGTYKPIKKNEFRTEFSTSTPVLKNENNNSRKLLSSPTKFNPDSNRVLSNSQDTVIPVIASSPIEQQTSPNAEELFDASEMLNEYFDEGIYQKLSTGEVDIPMVEQYLRERLPSTMLDYGTRMFWRKFAERTLHPIKESKAPINSQQNCPNMLPLMVDRLMAMRSSDLFFKLQFAKNYFPKFIAKYENKLIDMRTIVMKSQVNKYEHVFQVVHDVRRISYFAKIYLEFNIDPALLKAINEFDLEFDNLLHDEPFNMYHYDHIAGDPRENLYL